MRLQCLTFGANVLHCALNVSALGMVGNYLQWKSNIYVTLFANKFRNIFAWLAYSKEFRTASVIKNLKINAGILPLIIIHLIKSVS